MYSSSTQRPMGPGLARYGSAPSSLFKSLVQSSVAEDEFSAGVGPENILGKFFPADSSCLTTESACKGHSASSPNRHDLNAATTVAGLERSSSCSFGVGEMAPPASPALANRFQAAGGLNLRPGPSPSSLPRQSSSPAGFLSHLMLDNNGGGFSVTRGLGHYSSPPGCNGGNGSMANRILKSQLSFSRQDSISEISVPDVGESAVRRSAENAGGSGGHSYGNFRMGSWDETNSIVFSAPPGKRAKHINGDIVAALDHFDSEYSLPHKSVEMASVERLLQLQQDSVPCKIRAKRGCATHPRSLAERDRRTRISEKLRKLQELVPNMDKQTNTSEMLDLAVQHIKSLQSQVQELQRERANCICGSRNAT